MKDVVVGVLVLTGTVLMVLAAVGVVRMPDLFTRMQAASKAGAVGASLLLVGMAVHFWQLQVALHGLAAVAFLLLTAPVAAHVLARAGHALGVPLYRTPVDELRGHGPLAPRAPGADGAGQDAAGAAPDVAAARSAQAPRAEGGGERGAPAA